MQDWLGLGLPVGKPEGVFDGVEDGVPDGVAVGDGGGLEAPPPQIASPSMGSGSGKVLNGAPLSASDMYVCQISDGKDAPWILS